MRRLPACPRCEEDELWLWRGGDTFEVSCYLCGWKSGIVTLATGQLLFDVIAATVAAAEQNKKGAEANEPND